jgi:ribosome-binding protein aMBF1 (putative translation factor)
MLSTATALIDATQQAVMDDEVMRIAQFITHERHELSQDDFAKAMFMYSTAIASFAVDKATKAIMTKEQFAELCDTIDELETMRNEVLSNGE